jgi:hypothetical protein
MIDVHLPTTDGRNLILPRYTQPEKELQLLLHQLNLLLPEQPPPRLEDLQKCGADLWVKLEEYRPFAPRIAKDGLNRHSAQLT